MSPLYRFLLRFAIVIIVLFFAIQPYNWFCALTQSCRPFYLSDLIPKKEGKLPLTVFLEIKSYNSKLVFEPVEPIIKTVAGRKNTATYRLKNLGKRRISLRPNLVIEPPYFENNLIRHECLCSHIYRLKPGEEIEVQMRFEIKEDIEQQIISRRNAGLPEEQLKIRYEVKI